MSRLLHTSQYRLHWTTTLVVVLVVAFFATWWWHNQSIQQPPTLNRQPQQIRPTNDATDSAAKSAFDALGSSSAN